MARILITITLTTTTTTIIIIIIINNNNRLIMMMMIITTMIIMIIIIAFKGDFFTISSLRRELSPARTLKWPGRNRVQITCNTLGAHHAQHVVLRDTWYERTAHLLSLTAFKSHLFELYLTD